MNKISTGKRYEASGTVAQIDAIWTDLHNADSQAVRISAASDDVSSAGTDDKDAALAANRSNSVGLTMVDTES